jgi:hypothetical protein
MIVFFILLFSLLLTTYAVIDINSEEPDSCH